MFRRDKKPKKKAKFILQREGQSENATLGKLYLEKDMISEGNYCHRLCYTLEDIFRKKKIWGKTRIPAGVYPIDGRKIGKFYKRYKDKKRFGMANTAGGLGSIANLVAKYGVPWLRQVRFFKYILIHIGNFHKDTHGCLLCGMDFKRLSEKDDFELIDSTDAIIKVYSHIFWYWHNGYELSIEVKDEKK